MPSAAKKNFMAFSSRVVRLLMLSVVSLSVASCGTRTGKSTVSTTIGPRTVKATVDGGASITTKDDAAVVSFASHTPHTLTIEDERLLIDGEELVHFAADAKNVEISVADDRMTVTVDGKQVLDRILD
jgi:hypothetical protein